jgi:hypothetical protein
MNTTDAIFEFTAENIGEAVRVYFEPISALWRGVRSMYAGMLFVVEEALLSFLGKNLSDESFDMRLGEYISKTQTLSPELLRYWLSILPPQQKLVAQAFFINIGRLSDYKVEMRISRKAGHPKHTGQPDTYIPLHTAEQVKHEMEKLYREVEELGNAFDPSVHDLQFIPAENIVGTNLLGMRVAGKANEEIVQALIHSDPEFYNEIRRRLKIIDEQRSGEWTKDDPSKQRPLFPGSERHKDR